MKLHHQKIGRLIGVACCVAGGVLGAAHSADAAASKTVAFAPFKDPWSSARERFWDIDDSQYNAFTNVNSGGSGGEYKYSNANVSLSYDPAPGVPYFVGHISASGLKPNFAYQLKLTGKPARGTRGWGLFGDDWSNEQLGYAGRWWCDTSHASQTNFDDSHYSAYYKGAVAGSEHNIYGYLFFGSFVTDQAGSANFDFTGQNSFHVDWKDAQLTSSQKSSTAFVLNPASPFTIQSTTGYGYGVQISPRSRTLWYEYEPGRARNNVQLAAGNYNCRFLLTEESFHNPLSANYGGYWKTVLATEDFAKDANGDYVQGAGGALIPDSNAANDVVFTMGLVSAPANLAAQAGDAQIALSWNSVAGASSYTLKRSLTAGGPYDVVTPGITTTSTLDTAVQNGTTYFYIVTATNNAGEGAASNEANATPQAAPLSAPQNLTASALSNQIDLVWSPVTGATSYSILRGTTSGGPYAPLASDIITTQYTDTTALAGTTYFYVVIAVNGNGQSTPSAQASATVGLNTVSTPVISPNGGTFLGATTVTLSCATTGAQIRYTTNGSAPTSTSTLYSAPITLANSATVKAAAFKSGWQNSATASASFTINRSATFVPVADAHVRNGVYAMTNYGSSSSLLAKTNGSLDTSDIYLRFDLKTLTNINAASIKLRVYGAPTSNAATTLSAYSISNGAWTETGLTWNNRPALVGSKASVTAAGTTRIWYEINLSSYIKSELSAGRRVINLALHLPSNSSRSLTLNSREATAFGPQLVLAF
jgi:hypothetical protein